MSGAGERQGNTVPASVLHWSTSDVRVWLGELGMQRYSKILCDTHKIDGPALIMLQVPAAGQLGCVAPLAGARPAAAPAPAGGAGRCQAAGLLHQFPQIQHGLPRPEGVSCALRRVALHCPAGEVLPDGAAAARQPQPSLPGLVCCTAIPDCGVSCSPRPGGATRWTCPAARRAAAAGSPA